MTDSKALIERLRELERDLLPFAHKTVGSIRIDLDEVRAIVGTADHIEKLEADNARLRAALDDAFAQMVATFADPDRLKNSTLAMDAFCDAMERCRAALQETSHD